MSPPHAQWFSPSSRCPAPVSPPVLWHSCLRWRWASRGTDMAHEDKRWMVSLLHQQVTEYLHGSPSPRKQCSWTGTGCWGAEDRNLILDSQSLIYSDYSNNWVVERNRTEASCWKHKIWRIRFCESNFCLSTQQRAVLRVTWHKKTKIWMILEPDWYIGGVTISDISDMLVFVFGTNDKHKLKSKEEAGETSFYDVLSVDFAKFVKQK